MRSDSGCFITLEGIDGAGKSTHVSWIANRIAARGHRVLSTREPGGTRLGETLREMLLHQSMTHESETLLMFAARKEHVDQVLRPALTRGEWVLCDRFTDATFAYQGGGHGVALDHIAVLEDWIQGDCRPNRTFLFDVPPEVSRQRLAGSRPEGHARDKFEREDARFFDRVRTTYLERARADPQRFRIVNGADAIDDIREALDLHLAALEAEHARR